MSLAFFRRTVNRRVWKTLFKFLIKWRWSVQEYAGASVGISQSRLGVNLKEARTFVSYNYIINLIVRSQPLDDIPRVFPFARFHSQSSENRFLQFISRKRRRLNKYQHRVIIPEKCCAREDQEDGSARDRERISRLCVVGKEFMSNSLSIIKTKLERGKRQKEVKPNPKSWSTENPSEKN